MPCLFHKKASPEKRRLIEEKEKTRPEKSERGDNLDTPGAIRAESLRRRN
jgi:hypothetical protein